MLACALAWVLAVGWGAPARAQSIEGARALAGELVERAVEDGARRAREVPIEQARRALLAARDRAIIEDLSELPILSLELECAPQVCDREPGLRQTLRRLTGLEPGQPFAIERIQRAGERLFKTGMFANVDVQTDFTPEGVGVTIALEGAILIRSIEFEGVSPPPFREDLERVLSYRRGQPWLNDEDRASSQLRSLNSLLRREGYFRSEVSMRTERAPSDPLRVDLTFVLDKGPRLQLCELGVRGIQAMNYSEARALLLAERPIWTRYLDFLRPVYTERTLRAGQEALVQEYRERGFYQARIVDKAVTPIEDRPECVRVLVDVLEGPRWETTFRGNEVFRARELREALPFAQTGYVDEGAIEEAAERLAKLHATRGHPFARVEWREERRDRYDRELIFFIEEGPRLEVRQVELVAAGGGARAARPVEGLGDEELLEGLRTRSFGLFESGGFVQDEALLSDMAQIEQSYRERGYLRAVVDGFVLTVEEAGQGLDVQIIIDEGPRSFVASVEVEGGERGGSLGQLEALQIGAGASLQLLQVRADGARLKQRYAAGGFPMAEVVTRCRSASGQPHACEQPRLPGRCVVRSFDQLSEEGVCQWETVDGRRRRRCQRRRTGPDCQWPEWAFGEQVTVTHAVTEGPQVRVSDVLLRGNLHTRDGVILGEFALEAGDRFDVRELLRGQANMRSLGLFDSVSVEAVGLDEGAAELEQAEAALIVSVEEGDYQFVDFSFGLQGRDLLNNNTRRRLLLVGEAEYNNRNLWGLAQRLQPRALAAVDLLQLSALSTGLGTGALEAPEAVERVDYLIGLELVYNHPRFLKTWLGVDRLLLTVAPYFLRDLLGVTNNNLLREEIGARAQVRKNLSELLARLLVAGGLEGKLVTTREQESVAFTPDGERLFAPRRTVGKFFIDASLDRRDSPLNPTQGFFLQFSPQWVSGDALGQGAGDAIADSFLRMTLAASGYLDLGGGVVFAQSVRFGQIVRLFGRQTPVPPDERYVLGGVSSLRGFPESGINAQTRSFRDLLRGGEFVLNTNSELRYPLLARYDIFAATFLDVGVLADCFADGQNTSTPAGCYEDAFPAGQPLAKVRASAGFGVRYLVAEQIPLLLDYAMLLNRRQGESPSYLHFNIGYSF